MATPKRTVEAIREDIKRTRAEFVGVRTHRVALLEEALEQKRAERVADRILALEDELTKVAT